MSPCKECKDRTAEDPERGTKDCHSGCEKYREFQKELKKEKYEKYIAKAQDYMANTRPWMEQDSKAQREYKKEVQRDRKK